MTVRDQLDELNPEVLPVGVPVARGSVDYSTPASLRITATAPPSLLGSGLPGTLTGVHIASGELIEAGHQLYEVDGIAVTAYEGDVIFYRTLSRGDRGPDVEAAQALLALLLPEVSLTPDGTYGAATAAAVRSFERLIGVKEPTGVFTPAWFVRVPDSPYTIATISLRLGAPAPGNGEEIATAVSHVEQAALTVPNFNGPDGAYEFVTSGRTAPATLDQGEWLFEIDDTVQLLTTALSVDQPTVLEGRVRLQQGEPAQLIPGGSLITDDTGATCVSLILSEAPTPETVAVTVLGIEVAGPVQIAPTLPENSEVIINPYESMPPGPLSCPSA